MKVAHFWRRLRKGAVMEQELDEELRSFAGLLQDEGLTEREAALAMGGAEQVKEAVRAARAGAWVEGLARDIRYALRRLGRRPGYALAVVLVLAMGIGLTAALSAAVEALVLRPMPFPQPDELVQIDRVARYPVVGDAATTLNPKLHSLFTDFADYRTATVDISDGGPPERMRIAMVSPDFFRMFGGRMLLGSGPAAQDYGPRQHAAALAPTPVVLSQELWQARYGGQLDILGKTVDWGGDAYEIEGVAASEFAFPADVQAWIPFRNQGFSTAQLLDNPADDILIVRMRAGLTLATAEEQFDHFVAKAEPDVLPGPFLMPLQRELAGSRRELALLLWAASALVLLLAASGALALGMAQTWARRRELALRLAIGASAACVRRQLLVEGLLLGLASGTISLAVAAAASDGMKPWWVAGLPTGNQGLGAGTVLLILSLALACGAAIGVTGSPKRWRQDSGSYGRGAGPAGMRGGAWLTAVALGLAVVLVAGMAALVHSLDALTHVPSGMAPERVLTFEVSLPYDSIAATYAAVTLQHPNQHSNPASQALLAKGLSDLAAIQGFQKQARARLLALTGVEKAGLIGYPPLATEPFLFGYMPKWAAGDKTTARYVMAATFFTGPGALPALGVQFLSGHDFGSDAPPGCEEIWSQNMARMMGYGPQPGEIADGPRVNCHVLGIVDETRTAGLRVDAPPAVFRSGLSSDPSPFFVVRTAPGIAPEALMLQIRTIMQELAPQAPISHVATLASLIDDSHADLNRATELFSLFGLLALGIAGLTVFTMAVQEAAGRTQEIGLRMALGARAQDIGRLMLTRPLWLALGALLAAWPLAWMLGRGLEQWLFRAQPADAVSFGGTAGLLVLLVAAAAWVPAGRAMRSGPAQALRHG